MGFRFRKILRLTPGVRLNLGKRGMSVSLGGRGLTTNLSPRGTRTTVGLPGTGLSYSSFSPAVSTRSPAPASAGVAAPLSTQAGQPSLGRWLVGALVVLMSFALLPSGAVLLVLIGGCLAAWAYRWLRRSWMPGQTALARQWAVVKHNPRDPTYATLLAQWYGPGISDAERRANGVP